MLTIQLLREKIKLLQQEYKYWNGLLKNNFNLKTIFYLYS